jgi:protein required for attachment to host cells
MMKRKRRPAGNQPRTIAYPRWPRRYVVVADGGAARILRASRSAASAEAGREGGVELAEVARLENPAAHLPSRELVSDRTGRVFDSGSRTGRGAKTRTRHGAQSDYDPHAVILERFAARLAQRLDADRRRGRYAELVLIAGPKFLGVLRPQLPAAVSRLVTREIARDLVKAEDEQICRAAFGARRGPGGRA